MTVELNGKVGLRARGQDPPRITELVLNRSSYSGEPVRLNTNRVFLNRALRLGFTEIGLSGVESPVVCRDPRRIYAWQPLGGDAAIEPTESVIRIETNPANGRVNRTRTVPATPRRPMNESVRQNEHPVGEPTGSSLAALIQEAEALHASLAEARSNLARLIAGLRRHREQSRQLNEALKSLRQLRLTGAVE